MALKAMAFATAIMMIASSASAVTTTFRENGRGGPGTNGGVATWDGGLTLPDFGTISDGADMLAKGIIWDGGSDGFRFTMLTPFVVSLEAIAIRANSLVPLTFEIARVDPEAILDTDAANSVAGPLFSGTVFAAGQYGIRIIGSDPDASVRDEVDYDLRVAAIPLPPAILGVISAFGLAFGVKRAARRAAA